jgi:hypothetical protein
MTEQASAELTTEVVVKPAKKTKEEQSAKPVRQVKQKITLTAADPVVFVNELEGAILKGARVDSTEFPYIRSFPMRVGLYVEGPADKDDWLWKSTAHLNCYGIDVAQFSYTKEQLEELSWADFRKVCAAVGVKGRERDKMTKEYMEATE